MHIIVFAHRLATPRSLTVRARHIAAMILASTFVLVAGVAFFYFLTFKYAAELQIPFLRTFFSSVQEEDRKRSDEYLRQNLSAMAVKLGEMQAQLMRLDALGERVSDMAGIRAPELRNGTAAGRGGALATARDLSIDELNGELDRLSRSLDKRAESLNLAEAELFHTRLKASRLPTALPVNAAYNASGFGTRIDPITGQSAMHEGIDFIAPPGTPIFAAASGIVIASEWHHSFGNMVEIDHGGDIVTRYAHASTVLVKPGDLVKRGQKIAEVGSTGRSTGPHLHFEVRFKGLPQNPARFLQAGQPAAVTAKATRP
ncbi:MAG: M23 family metallopeptidase [Burkholderiales bacterium]|nr:M23 family metallopeptidase [Burkholderiales bacterium]